MGATIGRLMRRPRDGQPSRRDFLLSLAAVGLAQSRHSAQVPPYLVGAPHYPPIRVRTLNSIGITVSDVGRSVEWYQHVFGMPVQYTQERSEGKVAILAVGSGPEHLALYPANGSDPAIRHLGLGVPDYDRSLLYATLIEHRIQPEWVRRSVPGGDVEELWVRDPDGLRILLQDTSHCGGEDSLGNVCPQPWQTAPERTPPPLAVKTWNHLSYQVTEVERSVRFYQRVFDLRIQTMDYRPNEPVRLLGIVGGPQTVNPTFGVGAPLGGHFCLGVENWDYDRVVQALRDAGSIPPPGEASGWYSTDVYNPRETTRVRDPDGHSVQLTDVSFCGGTGDFGEICPGQLGTKK